MLFGIGPSEFLVLLVVAAVVLGPERLPQYSAQLARLVRELRRLAQGASEQVRSELGPEFDEVDWRKLDPRQYDPRRIVREALSDVLDPQDPLGLNAIVDKPVSRGGPRDRADPWIGPSAEPDVHEPAEPEPAEPDVAGYDGAATVAPDFGSAAARPVARQRRSAPIDPDAT